MELLPNAQEHARIDATQFTNRMELQLIFPLHGLCKRMENRFLFCLIRQHLLLNKRYRYYNIFEKYNDQRIFFILTSQTLETSMTITTLHGRLVVTLRSWNIDCFIARKPKTITQNECITRKGYLRLCDKMYIPLKIYSFSCSPKFNLIS